MAKAVIYVGNIVYCDKPFNVHTLEKGFIAVRDGKILAVDYASVLEQYKKQLNLVDAEEVTLKDSQILIPGLIDTHIHASQYPNIGLGLDKPLLEWLDTYTYPMERKFKAKDYAKHVYDAVVKRTLCYGTTTACYFASLYGSTSVLLADAAIKYGQRAFVGKVNMTRLAPANYVEGAGENVVNTRKFVETVLNKKSDLVKPIITPRFALSLSMDDMKELAKIAKEYNLPIQTHISENQCEVEKIHELFGMDYATVYDEAGLLTDKTILAHAVYLTKEEKQLLVKRGTSIGHCPSSNLCLRSGLCDVKDLIHSGLTVGLGTDVAGGRSVSILDAMRSALDTSISLSFHKDHNPLDVYDVFYLATLGGAKALSLDNVTGNFEKGKDFDALIVEADVEGSLDYLHQCSPLELLQKFVYTGDDRNIVSVFVAGKKVK